MKKLAVLIFAALFAVSASWAAFPDVATAKGSKTMPVKKYKKKDGIQVKEHKRSKPSKSGSGKKKK